MGSLIVEQKPIREPTVFLKARKELGVSQVSLANAIGVAPSTYAFIEEGVYVLSGIDNNPRVEAIAKFLDIPMEVAEAEAHKNLISGWHPAITTRSNIRYDGKLGNHNKRKRDGSPNSKFLGDKTNSSGPTNITMEEFIDMSNVNIDSSSIVSTSASDSQRSDIVQTILSELYGSIDFNKFIKISNLLDELIK